MKMLKRLLLLLSIVIWPSLLLAQNVTVTGTITDNNSTIYAGGTMTVTFVNTTGQQATFGGNPNFQKVYSAVLDNTGSFSISLPPNSTASPSIQPAGTQWNFAYTSLGNYGAANVSVTITGSGSISGTVSSLTRITWPFNASPPPCSTGQVVASIGSGNNGCTTAGGTPSFPLTVSGGVSGAVPCFTGTTTESAGTLLAANALVVGGGAGVCPSTGSADFTYSGHTITSSAGAFFDMHGSTTNGAFRLPLQNGGLSGLSGQMAVNTGSSGTNGSPLFWGNGTIIAYVPMIGGNGITVTGCTTQAITVLNSTASPTCGGLAAFITGSDYTNATGSATNVTGLSFPIAASTNYLISCKLIYQGSATTTTMTLTSTGPASPTKVTGQTVMDTTAGSGAAFFSGAFDGTTFGFTAGPPTAIVTTATDLYSTLDVGIINGVTAGTWQLQATNGTGTLTIKQGSSCRISN